MGLSSRGCVQVQKHAEKLQRAKEEAALGKLRAQWPELSEAVLVLALEEVSWETDLATLLLHKFQSALGPKLDALAQARQWSRIRPVLPHVQARLYTRKVLALQTLPSEQDHLCCTVMWQRCSCWSPYRTCCVG